MLWRKRSAEKEILKLNGKGRKYSSRFYSAMITATRKVPSSPFLSGVTECMCKSWLFDTRLSQQVGHSRLGYDGSGPPEPLTHPFWQLPSTLPKSHYPVFLSRDFGERIKDPRTFDVTSETRDDTSMIISKSRLTLQVSLPTCASLVTPSLIDNSARPWYYRVNTKQQVVCNLSETELN